MNDKLKEQKEKSVTRMLNLIDDYCNTLRAEGHNYAADAVRSTAQVHLTIIAQQQQDEQDADITG